MSEKSIDFDDKKINKSNFYKNKELFKIDEIDFDKILVSKKELYGTKNSLKYFIGYNDNDFIRPLCIKFPQMIGYVKRFDNNKTMSFKVIDNKLLQKYTKIWEKLSSFMNIKFDNKPVNEDSDKYIKTRTKSYGDKNKINTNFQGRKISKENASYKCLSLIMLHSVIITNKRYYPQTRLEECKYEVKKNKTENLINDNLEQSSSDESDNESDNGFDNEPDNDESND